MRILFSKLNNFSEWDNSSENHPCALIACKEKAGKEDGVEDAAKEGEEGSGKCQNCAEDLILILLNNFK